MVGVAKKSTVLKVDKLKKAYGPVTIVEGFNLQVAAGEAVALTGRNGAGKSTVLRCLVGADRPDEGKVEVLGVRMNLDLLARAHGIADPDDLVDEVLEEVQLVPQAGQLPSTLSSGQRRRLALATAFVRPRRLLVLDEPEQRLDVEGVEWLGNRLKAELQDGLANVLASHEPSLLAAIGAREVRLGERR